jgi:hypothetical protein
MKRDLKIEFEIWILSVIELFIDMDENNKSDFIQLWNKLKVYKEKPLFGKVQEFEKPLKFLLIKIF